MFKGHFYNIGYVIKEYRHVHSVQMHAKIHTIVQYLKLTNMNAFNRLIAQMEGEPNGEGKFNRKGVLTLLMYAAIGTVETLALSMILPI